MNIFVHAASAVPFLLTGHYVAAAICIAPDLAWLPNEILYRRSGYKNWYDWARAIGYSRTWLRVYRFTHSALLAPLAAFIALCIGAPFGITLLCVLAHYIHLSLDLGTHAGVLQQQPLYPLSIWRWPWLTQRTLDKWMQKHTHESMAYWFTDIVMFSGGWESTLCALEAASSAHKRRVMLILYNYGQSYFGQEVCAASRIAQRLNLPLEVVNTTYLQKNSSGVVLRRNETLAIETTTRYPNCNRIWIGCRAPLPIFDRYGDSNKLWAIGMGRVLGVKICTPALLMPKFVVRLRVALSKRVPAELVWSSEGIMP